VEDLKLKQALMSNVPYKLPEPQRRVHTVLAVLITIVTIVALFKL